MPRPKQIPKYSHHKASGKAVVRINGKDHYLGVHGSEESHEKYRRLIAEFLATGQALTACPNGTKLAEPSVDQVLLACFTRAQRESEIAPPTSDATRQAVVLHADSRPRESSIQR